MAAFLGTLRTNECYAALFNMILSQQNFADNIQKHQTLVEQAKEEAGLSGDQKLYYSTDALASKVWGADLTHPKGGVQDVEAANLLNVERAPAPACQALVIDCFRIIALTTDEYMSKRAWGTESAFADFTSIMIGWMADTRKVYEGTLYNSFIGTDESVIGAQQQTVHLESASASDPLYGLTGVEKEQMEAMIIAQNLADLFVLMGDYNRDFNDYQFLRSYSDENIKVIWNSKFVNKIRKVDLPTIFHKDGLVDKFEQEILPARYFGSVQGTAHTSVAGERSLLETDYTVGGVTTHVFPGDVIPTGASVAAGASYIVDDTIIAKVVVKLPPMLSAFSASTSFYNPRALITNRYLIWGHSTLEHLLNYPMITIRASY